MSGFLGQLPALLGVVIGAAGSYVAVTAGERARFRREQKVRWDERRITAYADYARAVKSTTSLLWRAAAHHGADPHPHPLSPDEAEPALAASFDRGDAAWEGVLLLGTADAVAAARRWSAAVREMHRLVRAGGRDPAAWSEAVAAARDARAAFYDAARADLGIPP
ncbi:hypothetical protein, partial [Streptomyces albus]|uniref:hypothetical protein n=1 Tax=Streptomyces albus TaxID=1888 RepID=UPI0004CA4105